MAIIGLMGLLFTAGPVSAGPTVRITPDYLRKIYRENLALYQLSRGDSATIVFSRGTLKRLEDLRKLHEAGQDDFVGVLLNHINKRCELVIQKITKRPISAESDIGRRLPEIYQDLLSGLNSMKSRETTESKRWTKPIATTRRLIQLINRQIEGPGTAFSTPEND